MCTFVFTHMLEGQAHFKQSLLTTKQMTKGIEADKKVVAFCCFIAILFRCSLNFETQRSVSFLQKFSDIFMFCIWQV